MLQARGTVGRRTLRRGEEELRIELTPAKKRGARSPFLAAPQTPPAVPHPRHGRARPCLASRRAPTAGVNGSQRARPPPPD